MTLDFLTDLEKIDKCFDKIAFMSIARDILCEDIIDSKFLNESNLINTLDYILHEASNDEILNILCNETKVLNEQEINWEELARNMGKTKKELGKSAEKFGREYRRGAGELTLKDRIQDIKDKAEMGWQSIDPEGKTLLLGAGGVILAIILIYSAYKLYRRYLTKMGRECAKASNKSECEKQFRNKIKIEQIKYLQKGLSICAQGNNSEKCKARINAKIQKLRSKIK